MLKNISKIISIFIFTFVFFPSVVNASSQSDYDYQLTQYRKYNTEFKILKEDNQKNPTLNNQQKALQAAKQVIISRDQTKIAYIEVIIDSLKSQNLTQDNILQTEKELATAKEFYKNQIILAKDIVSVEDLTNFTLEYLKAQPLYQTKIYKSLATNKLAKLIRFQISTKDAYNDLLPKITDKSLPQVSAGLTKITQLADTINNKLLIDIDIINTAEVAYSSKNSFFKTQTDNLNEIKTIQIDLINTLIDLERNYAN